MAVLKYLRLTTYANFKIWDEPHRITYAALYSCVIIIIMCYIQYLTESYKSNLFTRVATL